MEIEEVKTWQWMLAGLIAGVLFSCIVAWSGPGFEAQPRDTIETGEFENLTYALTKYKDLARFAPGYGRMQGNINKYHKDQPRVRFLTVHPPLSDDPKHQYWVTGESYFIGYRAVDPTKLGSAQQLYEEWKPFRYAANAPYAPAYTQREDKQLKGPPALDAELVELKKSLGNQRTFPSVNEYLKAVAALPNANLKFRQAWWERPAAMWSLPPLTGLLFIGIAWPLALSILQNFGVAKRAPVKAKSKTIAQPEPLNIRPTSGVILQPVKAVPPPAIPTEEKKYGGEFYPVVKVAHHEEVKSKAKS